MSNRAPEPEKSDKEKKRKTIDHKLSTMKKHPIRLLTEQCLLETYPALPNSPELFRPKPDNSYSAKAYRAQKALRWQYYRMITERPDERQRLTYCLNCRPSGFIVTPHTITCGNTRVCPWCYVRRLYSGYQELMNVDPKIRNLYSLLTWKREVPLSEKLPFFRTQYGPHQWCKALVTVQYAIPTLSPVTGNLTLLHVGFQVVPKGLDYDKLMTRNAVNPAVSCRWDEKITSGSVILAMRKSVTLPWAELLHADQLNQFMQLYDWNPGARLVRVSRVKQKGEKSGN